MSTAEAIAARTSTVLIAITPRTPRSLPGKSGLRRPMEPRTTAQTASAPPSASNAVFEGSAS